VTDIKKPQATGEVEIEDAGLDQVTGGGVGAFAGAGRGVDTGGGTPPDETPPITGMPTIGPAGPRYGVV